MYSSIYQEKLPHTSLVQNELNSRLGVRMPSDEVDAEQEEVAGDAPSPPSPPSRVAVCIHQVIECLEDRRAVTAKEISAPPLLTKLLNGMFLVLGLSLLLGVVMVIVLSLLIPNKEGSSITKQPGGLLSDTGRSCCGS